MPDSCTFVTGNCHIFLNFPTAFQKLPISDLKKVLTWMLKESYNNQKAISSTQDALADFIAFNSRHVHDGAKYKREYEKAVRVQTLFSDLKKKYI